MPTIVDKFELARILAVAPGTISRLIGEGLPILEAGGGRGRPARFDVAAVVQWWLARQLATDSAEPRPRDEYLRALTRRVEQDLAEKRGELVSRDNVVLAGQALVKGLSAKIRGLPRQLAYAGLLSREQEAEAAAICREILVDISNWRTLRDAERAAGMKAPRRSTKRSSK